MSNQKVTHTRSVGNKSASMKSLCDKSIFASCSAIACKFKERNGA